MAPGAKRDNKPSRRQFVGAEKAAILLLAIGKPQAIEILKYLPPEEVTEIERLAQDLRLASSEELDAIISEFEESFFAGVDLMGGSREFKELLAEAIGEPNTRSLPAPSEAEPIWPAVAKLPIDVLRASLVSQHPQAAAVVLSKLEPSQVAELLESLDKELRNILFDRLLAMRVITPSAMRAIEDSFRESLSSATQQASKPHAAVAGILNRLQAPQVAETLAYLDTQRPGDAQSLRKLLFNFEALATLAAKDLALVVDTLPVERVVLALQGTDAAFQTAILAVMAPRARRLAEAELRSGSTANPKDIAGARRAICDDVLKLSAAGTISLADAGETNSSQT